jgi:hypothetical protein
MEELHQVQLTKSQVWYTRLDRFLLYLIAGELGYFMLLMLGGVVVAILVFTVKFSPNFNQYHTSILWPVLIYIVALPFNMLGGFAGIILNICANHQGYPGTGHLLNWIFLATTGWLFILALVFMLPVMASGY